MKTINISLGDLNFSLSKSAQTIKSYDGSKMNRKKAYWLSQVSGWSFYALMNLFIGITFEIFSWEKGLVLLFLCVSGIGLTHIYRIFIKKNNWLNLSLNKLIPRVFISSAVIGALLYLVIFALNYATNTFEMNEFRAGTPIIGTVNLSIVILLWSLIYFSVHFFENYKKAEIESLIWEAAVKDFELKTLKSQLNPHFMFNALNSIRALIDEDPPNAQTAVTKLSNILRYSLKIDSTETVSLQDEMQTVADYLALETVRFEERLKYRINVDPKTFNVEVPPMMVQTLVENAIKHGISRRTDGGKINVSTKMVDSGSNGSMLQVQIRNTGQIDEQALLTSKGFGINNTKHRLNLIYGEKGFFSIKNYSNEEVVAELQIPTGGISNESFNNRR